MDDLVAWLRAQIDEDEADLTAPHRLSNEYCSDGAHWTDEQVLADCEAKRAIIDACANMLWQHEGGPDVVADSVLREYGAMYAKLGRPGYQESWRPA